MMESVHRAYVLGSRVSIDEASIRRMISHVLTLIGVGVLFRVYSNHWDPVSFLLIGFFIAPLILPFLGLGWEGVRMMFLSSISVALAAFVFPYVYLGILTPIAFLSDPEANFLLMACILAPIFEELAKGSMWILERGDWRHGAAIGLGFGCFEATSYLMVFGIDITFLRWQGTILHVVATAMLFQGLNTKQNKLIVGAIGLHIVHNSIRILQIMI